MFFRKDKKEELIRKQPTRTFCKKWYYFVSGRRPSSHSTQGKRTKQVSSILISVCMCKCVHEMHIAVPCS